MNKVCQLKNFKLQHQFSTHKKLISYFHKKGFSNVSNTMSNSGLFNVSFEKEINFRNSAEKFKCFRVIDSKGQVINPKYENVPKDLALKIFKSMIQINECDERFNMAQREGKISFYMTCKGEEAVTVASAAALSDEDMIFPQYREAASLLYRGFTIQEMANQLTGNEFDNGKGRQMPIHFGSKKLNYQTVSSPLCTQVPQASGAGYHYRVKNMNKVAVTYFGDGAASEGDFHTAMNFASTLKSQTLFLCRNNLFAISTSINEQFTGDGIAIRGIGYGINSLRVDGNDVFAVYNSVKTAREMIIKNKQPALIEFMTYRGGDHSTSDFSKMYRNESVERLC
jgi:2-oxoisovalerate dehydrogenase E1 component alpha subunit